MKAFNRFELSYDFFLPKELSSFPPKFAVTVTQVYGVSWHQRRIPDYCWQEWNLCLVGQLKFLSYVQDNIIDGQKVLCGQLRKPSLLVGVRFPDLLFQDPWWLLFGATLPMRNHFREKRIQS